MKRSKFRIGGLITKISRKEGMDFGTKKRNMVRMYLSQNSLDSRSIENRTRKGVLLC